MPNIPSMRGVKRLERDKFGENGIVTATVAADDTVTKDPNVNIHVALLERLIEGETLLWVYSEAGGTKTIKFGYDKHFDAQKIGHAALVDQAVIAGEIRKINGADFASGWAISNESGAWGAMGGNSGKSDMLKSVARTMTSRLGIVVTPEKAFSRYGFKRKLQELVRGQTRKV